jgi:hypothetical protein
MKFYEAAIASCALALVGSAAMADCAADLAELKAGSSGNSQGISKDGSLAPLEDPAEGGNAAGTAGADAGSTADATTGTTATSGTANAEGGTGDGIAKDGSHEPLEDTEAGGDTAVAMSGQDAAAQQSGAPTAAESAQEGTASGDVAASGAGGTTSVGGSDRQSALIAAAQAALDAGSEEACSDVIQLIKGQ